MDNIFTNLYQVLNYKMSVSLDCSICLCNINGDKNIVTTNCGHCYHASCLMRHVSLNGVHCPYCRTNMVDNAEPEEEEEEEQIRVVKKIIAGKKYFMDITSYTLYDWKAYVENGEQQILGVFDPEQNRIIDA